LTLLNNIKPYLYIITGSELYMTFKTIIFDLDGTVADTLSLCIMAFKKSVEPYLNREIEAEEILSNFGPSEEGTFKKLVPGYEAACTKAYLEHYEELHYLYPEPFSGIVEVLELLKEKNIQLAMVTGKGNGSAVISLKKLGLASYFEILETGSPLGPDKVNGINRILKKLDADLSSSLYIGDALSDIKYCKEVGIAIASVSWASTADKEKLEKANPDYLFETVEEFHHWIEKSV